MYERHEDINFYWKIKPCFVYKCYSCCLQKVRYSNKANVDELYTSQKSTDQSKNYFNYGTQLQITRSDVYIFIIL